MNPKTKKIVPNGTKFGLLTVIKEVDPHRGANNKPRRSFLCLCECGKYIKVLLFNLKPYKYLSCGCYIKHSLSKSKRSLICNIGVNDYDGFVRVDGRIIKSYEVWRNMLKRCYDGKYQAKYPTYIGCTICDEWLYFSNFKKWFDKHYVEGYELDKDILVKGNKVYSPSTCCFVPRRINLIIIKSTSHRGLNPIGVHLCQNRNRFVACVSKDGESVQLGVFDSILDAFHAYKQAKEVYIKEVATEYYKDNKISKNVYDALMTYEVEITD